MAIEAGTVYVGVEADMSNFADSAAKGVEDATSGASSKLSEWGSTIGVLAGGAFALNFGRKSLAAFDTLQKGTARLKLGLDNLGTGAEASLQPILDWARNFSLQTGINESSIVDMTSRLVTMGSAFFTAVGPQADEMLQLLVEDLNDLGAATGLTAQRLMRTLGPALLTAPEKAIPTLLKYGAITQDVADQITQMAKAGNKTGASILALNSIQEKFGGTAAKIATPLEKLKNMINLLEQNVGSLLSPVISLVEKIAEWGMANQGLVQTLAGGLGLLYLVAKFKSILDGLAKTKVVTYLADLGSSLAKTGAAAADMTSNTADIADAASAAGEQLTLFADASNIASAGMTAAEIAAKDLAKAQEVAAVATSRWTLALKGLGVAALKFGPWLIAGAALWWAYSKAVDASTKFNEKATKSFQDMAKAVAEGTKNQQDLQKWAAQALPQAKQPSFWAGLFGAPKQLEDQTQIVIDNVNRVAIGMQKAAIVAAQVVAADRALWQSSLGQARQYVGDYGKQISLLAAATGTSVGKMRSDITETLAHIAKAFSKDHTALQGWTDFVAETMQSAREAIASFKESASQSLNFAAQTFATVASDFKGSSEDILSALQDSFTSQKSFSADLNKILKDGTKGSKLLVQQLLALGPAGAAAAHAIATGSKETRKGIEGVLSASQSMADKTANKLSRTIVGTLKDIRDLLNEIAHPWMVHVRTTEQGLSTFVVRMGAAGFKYIRGYWAADAQVRIHTGPASPWPDEVIHDHMKKAGFRLLNGIWRANAKITLVLDKSSTLISDLVQQIKDTLKTDAEAKVGEAVSGLVQRNLDQAKNLMGHWNDATKALERLITKLGDFRSAIKDGFSEFTDLAGALTSAFDTYDESLAQYQQDLADYQKALFDWQMSGGVGAAPVEPTKPALDMAGTIASQVAEAQRLAKDLQDAAEAGLSKALLAQFAGQGAAASPVLEALLQNPELIAQLNKASAQIAKAANSTATKLGDEFFGKAIEKAAARIDVLSAHLQAFIEVIRALLKKGGDALDNALARIGNALQSQLQALSTAGAGAGAGTGGGGPSNKPSNKPGGGGGPSGWHWAQGGIVTRPTWGVVGEAGPEAVIPLGRGMFEPVVINVNAGALVHQTDLPRYLRDALLQLERRNLTTGLAR